MNFQKRDNYHAVSECGSYTINKAGQGRGRLAYMAVAPRGVTLGVWHCEDEPGERAAAYCEAVEACIMHAQEANQ